jgi:hypothetical protein
MNVESTGGSGIGLFLVIELAVIIFMLVRCGKFTRRPASRGGRA